MASKQKLGGFLLYWLIVIVHEFMCVRLREVCDELRELTAAAEVFQLTNHAKSSYNSILTMRRESFGFQPFN